MIDDEDNENSLSPAALSLISDILMAQMAALENKPLADDTRSLVRYLCRALSQEQARDVESALVSQRELCMRLIEGRRILDRLQNASWSEVQRTSVGDSFEAEAARAWMELATERIALAENGWEKWLRRGWQSVLSETRNGAEDAQAVWAAFLSFGERLKVSLSVPRTALARGGNEDAILSMSVPQGVDITNIFAEMTSSGNLEVVANIMAAEDSNVEIENQSVGLALKLNGEIWPIGITTISNGLAEWNIPEVRSILNLPAGKISPRFLHFSFPVGDNQQAEIYRLPFASPVMDEKGRAIADETAEITINGQPRWEDGCIITSISLPAVTRQKYPHHHLVLELIVAEGNVQRLGEWPVAEWRDEPLALKTPSPGSPSMQLTRMSLRPSLQTTKFCPYSYK